MMLIHWQALKRIGAIWPCRVCGALQLQNSGWFIAWRVAKVGAIRKGPYCSACLRAAGRDGERRLRANGV